MRLYLINPSSSLVTLANTRDNRWNRYRIWKPLSLLVLAAVTPPQWEIKIIDENLATPDYNSIPKPDLVGITACSAQATRAYELAAEFRKRQIPVVMGGIHATMCPQEAANYVDSVVTGEAENIWPQVLNDANAHSLKVQYDGNLVDINTVPPARHDLLPKGYVFGSIQTTRGCPLNCRFCSVTAFNGPHRRNRPIPAIIDEFKMIREKLVLVTDDNLIGTAPDHIEWTKELLRAMIREKINKKWIAQTTINFADDLQLLKLATKAGCKGVFIGFESTTPQGLAELGKNFNFANKRDIKESVKRIRKHGILIVGSFIIGLDSDKPGTGKNIAQIANYYGIDFVNTLILTPLPGTRLWQDMNSQDRIAASNFPEDWKYYTLTLPVAKYKNITGRQIINEVKECESTFYSISNVIRRITQNIATKRSPFITLAANLSYRNNRNITEKAYQHFLPSSLSPIAH